MLACCAGTGFGILEVSILSGAPGALCWQVDNGIHWSPERMVFVRNLDGSFEGTCTSTVVDELGRVRREVIFTVAVDSKCAKILLVGRQGTEVSLLRDLVEVSMHGPNK